MEWNESITSHNFYHPHCISIIIGIKSSQTTFCRHQQVMMTMMPHHRHHYLPLSLDTYSSFVILESASSNITNQNHHHHHHQHQHQPQTHHHHVHHLLVNRGGREEECRDGGGRQGAKGGWRGVRGRRGNVDSVAKKSYPSFPPSIHHHSLPSPSSLPPSIYSNTLSSQPKIVEQKHVSRTLASFCWEFHASMQPFHKVVDIVW